MRSDGDLRVGTVWKVPWSTDGEGLEFRFGLQHLRARGTSAWADWKSGRGLAPRGAAARADELPLFCGQHPGGPFFQRHTGGTQQECDEVPSAVGGAARGSTSATSPQPE